MSESETVDAEQEFDTDGAIDSQWRASLYEVMRQVVHSLPDHTTLDELVAATRSNSHLAPVLAHMSVQELIDLAIAKPEPQPEIDDDDDLGLDPLGDNGPAVIRRRADVPDGDIRVLSTLAERGPQSEAGVCRNTRLTSEQIRLILRHLRSKGLIHIEGSGTKRRIKITRSGGSHLRRHNRRR